jgi:outer membrane protein OmpA-like peptidoglycan-associated protein
MKTTFLMTVAMFFYATVAADTKKADRLFDQWEYFRAAKLYQQEAAKQPGADVYFKLGECYRKMNLYNEEQAAYDKVNAYGVYSNPEFYLSYGQVLRTNGRTEEAKVAFDKFTELTNSDYRGKFFSDAIAIVAEDHKWDEPVSVTNVAQLNTANADLCPVVYKDGIVFTSNRNVPGRNKTYGWTGANYLDLYYAKSGTDGLDYSGLATFGGNKIIKNFNDGPACFSRYFDTIYISRVDKEMKGLTKRTLGIERNKIYMATMKEGKWTEAVPFHLNSNYYSVANPFLTADGSRLYFVSDMPGGYGETDIYYCNRKGASWGAPINMGPNINTFNREKYPYMDAHGNFYFSSDGYQGFGGLDICVALSAGGTFTKAIPMKYPFNSPADDFGFIVLNDGKAGYITSTRYSDGLGDDDIYYFNLLRDRVDTGLQTSVYTIGYRPKVRKTEITNTIAEKPKNPAPKLQDIVIFFDYDESYIRSDAIVHLDSVINLMHTFPTLTLLITGNCDCRGTSAYNRGLAIRRSDAALRYLNEKGISISRMTGEGYGVHRVPAKCEEGVYYSYNEHQLNRTVSLHFINRNDVFTK